jgi:hypothetical protein
MKSEALTAANCKEFFRGGLAASTWGKNPILPRLSMLLSSGTVVSDHI